MHSFVMMCSTVWPLAKWSSLSTCAWCLTVVVPICWNYPGHVLPRILGVPSRMVVSYSNFGRFSIYLALCSVTVLVSHINIDWLGQGNSKCQTPFWNYWLVHFFASSTQNVCGWVPVAFALKVPRFLGTERICSQSVAYGVLPLLFFRVELPMSYIFRFISSTINVKALASLCIHASR